ncbi:MAG: carboxylating nicotinate-nucleotide diphosphorylase [archaeon]
MTNITKIRNIQESIVRAIKEDIGSGDVTTISLVSPQTITSGLIIAREEYTISGNDVAKYVFKKFDPNFQYLPVVKDGQRVKKGAVVAKLRGKARAMLTGERTALNFLQRMSGIASKTHDFTRQTKKYGVKILDTRKTTPGLRLIEKYSVKCGGGTNHRIGLYDMVLIKDNHRALWSRGKHLGFDQAIRVARKKFPKVSVEIEVESLAELKSALQGKPDWVLLDNMKPELMKKCVKLCKGKCKTEASGGINQTNIIAAARTGVDAISLGCLTHSAPAADLSLEII